MSKKIEELVEKKIADNKAYRKALYKIWPSLLILSIFLISVDWWILGSLLLIANLLYGGTWFVMPIQYEKVKAEVLEDLEKKRQAKLEAERLEQERQEEAERLERERQENIKKYGCSFENTHLIVDDFSDTKIITTKLFRDFKQSALNTIKGVNQSVQLQYNELAMPSVNIDTMYGMWGSAKVEKKDDGDKYFLEFHFRHHQRTKDKGWGNKPSAENCVLDLVGSGEKFSFSSTMTRNDQDQYDYNLLESKMSVKQTFHFEVSVEALSLISTGDFKLRMSNFSNRGKDGSNEYRPEGDFLGSLKTMVAGFCSDLAL